MSAAGTLAVAGADRPLSTRLDGPIGDGPLLVLGHGAGAGIDHPGMADLAGALAERGLAVLRYQFPFMERRGGAGFGRDPLPLAVATVAAAVERGRALAAGRPLFAGGHSWGGRMTAHAAAAGLLPEIAGLVLASFPLHGAKAPGTERARHLPGLGLPLLFVSGERDALARAPLLEDCIAGLGAAELARIAAADHGWKAPKRVWPDGPLPAVADAIAAWCARTAGLSLPRAGSCSPDSR